MRGHIVKRYKSSYTIVLTLGTDPATGKRKQQWISIKGTKRDAEKRMADLIHQLDTGTFMKPGKTSLAEFLERWLKDYVIPNLSPRTAEGYESIMRYHVIPALGRLTLTQLRTEHIQKFYASRLETGMSTTTARHIHMALHRALSVAEKWGLLARNPSDAATIPPVHRKEMQTWNEDEVYRFLTEAKKGTYYALFYTALYTGMRRSELLGLTWGDVDFLMCQLRVTRGLHQVKGQYVYTQPKTARSRRTIALPPSALAVLQDHRLAKEAEALMVGKPITDGDLVFSLPDGEPLRPNTITRAWAITAARSGVKVIRLHDARHTHASLMLKQNVHPKIVQERLGHASISITLDTYSHVAPGMQQAAANAFDVSLNMGHNDRVEEKVR